MELVNDISLYLPRFLSDEKREYLKQELKAFSDGCDSGKYYTNRLKDSGYLFQGDIISDVPYLNFPNLTIKPIKALILSNTCDMDINNSRPNPTRIMYAPLLSLNNYQKSLVAKGIQKQSIDSHISSIKDQLVSQILYLPNVPFTDDDAIVLFDQTISCPLDEKTITRFIGNRLTTLNNFGFYLLLLKLSYHFTRVQDGVDRD